MENHTKDFYKDGKSKIHRCQFIKKDLGTKKNKKNFQTFLVCII